MTKQDAIDRVKKVYNKKGKVDLREEFYIWNNIENGKKDTDRIYSVDEDGGEICAIGKDLVYPLNELSKRELESIYTLIK